MRVGPSEGRPSGWINGCSASSAAPVLTAFLTASVSTHHTQPEPDDRTQDRRGDRGSQSGHVKCQMRKSSRTSSVFWIMKTISSPIPVSDAMAPAPILRPSEENPEPVLLIDQDSSRSGAHASPRYGRRLGLRH